jgi:hypothetical protein
MSGVALVWATGGIVALLLLPVGSLRMLAYRSGEVDHTPQLRFVARLALGIGSAGLVVFLALSVWFLVTGERPL